MGTDPSPDKVRRHAVEELLAAFVTMPAKHFDGGDDT